MDTEAKGKTPEYRVEAPASPRNDVSAGIGKMFADLESAKAYKQQLVDSGQYADADVRIVPFGV